jgi:hypothetical protein
MGDPIPYNIPYPASLLEYYPLKRRIIGVIKTKTETY